MRKSDLDPSSNLETALKHRRWVFTGCRYMPSPPKVLPRRSLVLTATLHHPYVQMRRAGIQSGWRATCLRSGRGLSFPGEGHPWGKWEGKASTRGTLAAASQGAAGFILRDILALGAGTCLKVPQLTVRALGRGHRVPSIATPPQVSPRTKTPRRHRLCSGKHRVSQV